MRLKSALCIKYMAMTVVTSSDHPQARYEHKFLRFSILSGYFLPLVPPLSLSLTDTRSTIIIIHFSVASVCQFLYSLQSTPQLLSLSFYFILLNHHAYNLEGSDRTPQLHLDCICSRRKHTKLIMVCAR